MKGSSTPKLGRGTQVDPGDFGDAYGKGEMANVRLQNNAMRGKVGSPYYSCEGGPEMCAVRR